MSIVESTQEDLSTPSVAVTNTPQQLDLTKLDYSTLSVSEAEQTQSLNISQVCLMFRKIHGHSYRNLSILYIGTVLTLRNAFKEVGVVKCDNPILVYYEWSIRVTEGRVSNIREYCVT